MLSATRRLTSWKLLYVNAHNQNLLVSSSLLTNCPINTNNYPKSKSISTHHFLLQIQEPSWRITDLKIPIFDTSSVVLPHYHYKELLESCILNKSLSHGKQLHQHLLKTRFSIHDKDFFILLQKVTHLYISCDEVELARRLFDQISSPSVILWNLMIRAYAWNGPFHQALDLYYCMLDSGVRPTKFTFPFVLKACSALRALEIGREIHYHVKTLGLNDDLFVCTALIDLYAKCGDLDGATVVFDSMSCRDIVAWNAMIAGFSLHGLYDDTVHLLARMQREGTNPNSSTIVAVLPTIARFFALRQGKAVHGYSIRRKFTNDVVVGTGLLDMYAKCKCISYARKIFDMIEVKNEVCWSAMIGAYVICESTREALELFNEMLLKKAIIPTAVTLGCSLRACAKLTDLRRGRQLHCYTIKLGLDLDTMVGNTLLSLYAKCGNLDEAFQFFDGMISKDTVSYSALISGFVQNGYAKEALLTFHQMQLVGIEPDLASMLGVLPACSHLAALQHGICSHAYSIIHGFAKETSISNALIEMYSKCGKILSAREVFNRMQRRDIISWNTLIVGYGIHGLGVDALALFHTLLDGDLRPDDVTFIGLLSACSHSGLVTEGKHWFHTMSRDYNIIPRLEHYICMVDLLGRAGFLDEAHDFIWKMPFQPDVRVWGNLLGACKIYKNIELGEEVSNKIQALGPESSGNFVLLSNIYSVVGRWDDAENVRIMQKKKGFKKIPGCCWVEIGGVIHTFVGGDRLHPKSSQIYEKLEELLLEMRRLGYGMESSFVMQDIEEEEKELALLYHSEKLAIAFGIISLSPTKPILVTKNLRVCVDCHSAIKFITLVTKRQITVRDASRFHHFRDGVCNCGDFW